MNTDNPGTDISRMNDIVQKQLALDLNCTPEDFDREGVIFCECADNPGRRPFPREGRHFEMLTMGKGIVVSASADLLPRLREQLKDKFRDDIFSQHFVYGHSLYYLPDTLQMKPAELHGDFELKFIEKPDIAGLYGTEGFRNALQYDSNHPRPDVLAAAAMCNGAIAGVAGASADCAEMWQIGIDVLPEYRNKGLAAELTKMLSAEILNRGCIPYYGTASSNIPSQRVAHRAGFKIGWVCCYRGLFDDTLTMPTS